VRVRHLDGAVVRAGLHAAGAARPAASLPSEARTGDLPACRPLWCFARHQADDPALGRPLCARCFDAEALVSWNATAPELWRRTTVYLRRALARLADETPTALGRRVRVSYGVARFDGQG
jgi:Replication initiator protein, pSAM2